MAKSNISRTPIPLCTASLICSEHINYWLKRQPEAKEESLTDWLLFALSEYTDRVIYKQFNRIQEGRETAADWEWWFILSDTTSFACRIQAKKLSNKDNYPGLAYVSGDKLQIERLIENAEQNNFAAFYVLYSDDDGNNKPFPPDIATGIYMCEASIIFNSFIAHRKKPLLPPDILTISNPLPWYLCIDNKYEEKGGENFVQTIFFGPPADNNTRHKILDSNGLRKGFKKTPRSIQALLKEEGSGEDWSSEFSDEFKDVKAVLITDFRPVTLRTE